MTEEQNLASGEITEASLAPATLDATVVAASHQVSCDLSGESIVLDLDTGIYYGLNEVGARVWTLVQTPVTLRAVLTTLLAEYDVELERCERDLLELVRELAECGLLEVREG